MDFSDPVTKQYLIASVMVVLGVAGCFAPLKWNPLKLKRSIGKHMSDNANLMVARVLGAVLILSGGSIGIMTMINGPLQ